MPHVFVKNGRVSVMSIDKPQANKKILKIHWHAMKSNLFASPECRQSVT